MCTFSNYYAAALWPKRYSLFVSFHNLQHIYARTKVAASASYYSRDEGKSQFVSLLHQTNLRASKITSSAVPVALVS